MTSLELERLLEARTETPAIEFKRSCEYAIELLAKDVLAMANLEDGGHIIVGVTDEDFRREGVSAHHEATYRVDIMRDQIGRFADPHVRFNVDVVPDDTGRRYVVIRVHPFDEVPVICAIDHERAGVHAATLYYRSNDRRPASAAVATAYDLRNILEVATVRMMRRRLKSGYKVAPEVADPFDQELGDL